MATSRYKLLSRTGFRDAELDQVTSRCDTVLDIQVAASPYQVLNELLSIPGGTSVIREGKGVYKEGE